MRQPLTRLSARSSLCAATFLAPLGTRKRRWTPRRCAPSFSLLAQLASQRSSLACGDQRCGVLLRSMLEFAVLRPSVDSDSDLLSILSSVLGGVEMSFKRSSV